MPYETPTRLFQSGVGYWLKYIEQYAKGGYLNADTFANNLLKFSSNSFTPTVNFKKTLTDSVRDVELDPIEFENLDLNIISQPSRINLNTNIINSSVIPLPVFTDRSPDTALTFKPLPFKDSKPLKNFTLNLNRTFPEEPVLDLPKVPSLVDLSIPDYTVEDFPTFSETLPTLKNIGVPSNNFIYNDLSYTSSLSDDISSKLQSRLSKSTGLPIDVEEGVFNRERDREQITALQAENTLLKDRASFGFSRPTGSTLSALNQIVQNSQSKIIDLSRDIMIKQADLEQENFKTSMQQSISFEESLMKDFNSYQQRILESAKYTQESSIEVYKTYVLRYNTELEAYKASSEVFKSRISSELMKVELFKSRIEAQKVRGEINEQNIKVYLAKISSLQSTVDLYKTRIQAVAESLKVEGLKIETYKSDIQAYTSLVLAKGEEFKAYGEEVRSELSKADIYKSKVQAYLGKVQAYSESKRVSLEENRLNLEKESLRIKKYLADIENYKASTLSKESIFKNNTERYKSRLQGYLSKLSYGEVTSKIDLAKLQFSSDQNKFEGNLQLENYKLQRLYIEGVNKNKLEALKASGSIYAQVASSAFSALNVSASYREGISESFGNSNINSVNKNSNDNRNVSHLYGKNTNNNYNTGTNTNTNYNTGTNTNTNTNTSKTNTTTESTSTTNNTTYAERNPVKEVSLNQRYSYV